MSLPKISKMHARVKAVTHNAAQEENLKKLLDQTTHLQENTFWDDAKETYRAIVSGYSTALFQMGERVKQFLASDSAKLRPEVLPRLTTLINQVKIDTDRLMTTVNETYARHADRSGRTVGYDDHALLLQINEAYSNAVGIYNAATGASVSEIMELIGVADAALAEMRAEEEEKKKAELADPTVVSDAIVKEV